MNGLKLAQLLGQPCNVYAIGCPRNPLAATDPQPPWLTGSYHPSSTTASTWDYRSMRRTRR
jgi:hypothetical protein